MLRRYAIRIFHRRTKPIESLIPDQSDVKAMHTESFLKLIGLITGRFTYQTDFILHEYSILQRESMALVG